MAVFRINETQVTEKNQLEVETEPSGLSAREAAAVTLQPGVHRFELVVEDDDGNRSKPFPVDVLVRPRRVVVDPKFEQTRPVGRGGIGGLGGLGGPFKPKPA
jgi:hypothetical protein